jgi:hypothetical protein
MLTNNEKKIIRLLIEAKPQADYMQQLASDDDFALEAIRVNKPILIEQVKAQIAHDELAKSYIETNLEKLYSKLTTLEG